MLTCEELLRVRAEGEGADGHGVTLQRVLHLLRLKESGSFRQCCGLDSESALILVIWIRIRITNATGQKRPQNWKVIEISCFEELDILFLDFRDQKSLSPNRIRNWLKMLDLDTVRSETNADSEHWIQEINNFWKISKLKSIWYPHSVRMCADGFCFYWLKIAKNIHVTVNKHLRE